MNNGKEIFVIGCGPSLKGFDWTLLADKITIAVNGSILDVPKPSFFITANSSYAVIAAKNKFWGKQTYKVLVMSQTHKRLHYVKPFIYLYDYYIIPKHGDGQIGLSEDEFATGQNSGFCGLQYAVILGAKVIHLLGMDFCNKGGNNYHGRYPSKPEKFDEFLLHFRTAIGILKGYNIEVISRSPISRLNDIIEYRGLYA